MNFDEWVKEMSKGAIFSGDDENSDVVGRINPLVCEEPEEEEPQGNWSRES